MKKTLSFMAIGMVAISSMAVAQPNRCSTFNNNGVTIEICAQTSNAGVWNIESVPDIPGNPQEYPLDAIEFDIDLFSGQPGESVNITFPDGHVPSALKKCRRGYPIETKIIERNNALLSPRPPWVCSPISGATLNGNTWSYYIEDNGPLDLNNNSGRIHDPISFQYAVPVPLSTSQKILFGLMLLFGAGYFFRKRQFSI